MGALRIFEANDAWVMATAGRILVTVWRADVTALRVAMMDRVITDLVRSIGDVGYASISVIEKTISMRMPDDARDASASLQRRWAQQMKCQAYLVEGSGFLPATVRTLTSGLHLLTRSPYPLRVFSDPLALSEWIGPHVSARPEDVRQAIAETRSAGV